MEYNILSILGYVAVIAAVAFLVEGGVEYLLGEVFNLAERLLGSEDPKLKKLLAFKPTVLKYAAAVAGILVSVLVYKFDAVALIGQAANIPIEHTVFGMIATGYMIGRGASFVHQFFSTKWPEAWPS